MYSIKSLDTYEIEGRGIVFYIESPVTVERNYKSMMAVLGGVIEIDGKEYVPKGFEWHVPATPVYVGEKIGVLVGLTNLR